MPSESSAPGSAGRRVQLEVAFESADALVTAYTASLSKGGLVFMSDKPLEVGTRFDFRMKVEGEPEPVMLLGLVVRCKRTGARHQVAVQYLPTEASRGALGRLLGQMAQLAPSQVREEARIPVNLIARDVLLVLRTFVIENLSHGGMGVSFAHLAEHAELAAGSSCGLEVRLHSDAAVVLRGTVMWIDRHAGGSGARFGVKFSGLSEADHLVIAGMMQLFRPQSLLLALGDQCLELLAKTPGSQKVSFDPQKLIDLVARELEQFLTGLAHQPCRVVQSGMAGLKGTVAPRLKFCADLTGDIDMELALYTDEPSLGLLARGAGFEAAGREALRDAGLELLSTLAGHVADQMEKLGFREEVLPNLSGEVLSARRPFDCRVLFDVSVGPQSMLLELLLRLQTFLHPDFPDLPTAQQ